MCYLSFHEYTEWLVFIKKNLVHSIDGYAPVAGLIQIIHETRRWMRVLLNADRKLCEICFPQSIDEYIPQDAPVRAYAVFVDALDFDQLGTQITSKRGYRIFFEVFRS